MDPVTPPVTPVAAPAAAPIAPPIDPAADAATASVGAVAPKPRKGPVWAARTALAMLAVAALVLLGLGLLALARADGPETSGWLRLLFGTVFGYMAVGMAAVLGVPSGIGLWAMAGATKPGAAPALGALPRRVLLAVAVAVTALTAVVLLVTGSAVAILNLALLALAGMATLGLAGAAWFSPHRWRAIGAGVALVVIAAGVLWILGAAFVGSPAAAA